MRSFKNSSLNPLLSPSTSNNSHIQGKWIEEDVNLWIDEVARPPERKKVRFIILGLGHMGLRGLLSLSLVTENIKPLGIEIEIFALIDPDREKMKIAQRICEALQIYPQILPKLTEDLLDEITCPEEIIIYDASPTPEHFSYFLSLAWGKGLKYFGEKPLIITDRGRLEQIRIYWTYFVPYFPLNLTEAGDMSHNYSDTNNTVRRDHVNRFGENYTRSRTSCQGCACWH
jgi:hypothetical protein